MLATKMLQWTAREFPPKCPIITTLIMQFYNLGSPSISGKILL